MVEEYNIYQHIAERTGGDIYIGVVGPVRTGKSTFIKRFMDQMVIPYIHNDYIKERAQDELPQSGAGRTITTTEPKFVPNQAAEINLGEDNIDLRVRLVDCVGYTVPGALGYEEEDGPRMVRTPWYDKEVPFEESAELGTRKVISEHSTLGLVITTDGTITEIPRFNYLEAEERVIGELKALKKPFVILLNSAEPEGKKAQKLKEELEEKYQVPVMPVDCMNLDEDDISALLKEVLYEFPIREISVNLPPWVEVLEEEHWLRQDFYRLVGDAVEKLDRIRDIDKVQEIFNSRDFVSEAAVDSLDLGKGLVDFDIHADRSFFYNVLEEISGLEVEGDHDLLELMRELTEAKQRYDKVAGALSEVEEKGYGIVLPTLEELDFEDPEIIQKGNQFGIKLRAKAPSLHLIRADIESVISPLVGTEKQCKELITFLKEEFEKNPERILQSDFFGRSLKDLVKDGIQNKLSHMPENAQARLRDTLEKIVNEGSGGLICIIL